MAFSFRQLIERKRDGGILRSEEIRWLIAEYSKGQIPDYQMAAMLMAVFKEGLDGPELDVWTDAMLHSGEVLDLSHIDAPKVDKHSTGGVGDKVSIPLAPMVAACGVAVPMMSGRGLGHTGGTVDKLETIPGFRTRLSPQEFIAVVEKTGLVLAGQSGTLAPADGAIYALRDATGSVPSIPLIASSIMSKKLAVGLGALVLDVKVGRGAFMKELDQARLLAETMVGIGEARGTPVVAVLTDMNQPLGRMVGNANEIAESVEVLHGGGPRDLVEVVYRLAEEMLLLAEIEATRADARLRLERAVSSGAAFEKFEQVVLAQGGDPAVLHDTSLLAHAKNEHVVLATHAGYVVRIDAFDIGMAALRLGAGRERKEDDIDPGVGLAIEVKVGDEVNAGQVLARIYWNEEARLADTLPMTEGAFEISEQRGTPLVYGEVRSGGVAV
ncbi:MAG TPA: thymidine phosphorylase [Acidimicrobiia bacterium]|nr:thymidine phosphorylase [Acidimicrobiia bacterium]